MKKNLTKKLVLKKHTVASLNDEQLEALRGGATKQWKCYYSDGETLCGSCEFCGGGGTETHAGQASCYWQCTGSSPDHLC